MSDHTLSSSHRRGKDRSHSNSSDDAPKWLKALAKAGYGSRALIYIIIGALALLQAFGEGGESTDSKGAVNEVLQAPGGVFILALLALGLVGYSAWRLCQSVLDADNHGTGAKGIAVRGGLFVSAITHLILAIYAASLAFNFGSSSSGGSGSSGGDSGSSSEGLVATMLGWPGGRWLVGLLALVIAGVGVAHAVKAAKGKYRDRFEGDRQTLDRLEPICKFGLYARGVAFFIVAGMFVSAALTQDPDDAGGMQEVLQKTSEQPYGMVLLGVLAAGFIAFGMYSAIEAVYRKINAPSELK